MRKLKSFIYFFYKKATMILTYIFLYGVSLSASADAPIDDLSGVMDSVSKTFGLDSTFMKLLYLLEIIVGIYTYHKTKNFAALLGIIFISVFANYALPHWVFKT